MLRHLPSRRRYEAGEKRLFPASRRAAMPKTAGRQYRRRDRGERQSIEALPTQPLMNVIHARRARPPASVKERRRALRPA